MDADGTAPARTIESSMVVSDLARVEAAAAFWRHHRLGNIDAADAAALTERHPLRAGDALQLASALAARAADPAVQSFATADRTLATAAERERFLLVPGL